MQSACMMYVHLDKTKTNDKIYEYTECYELCGIICTYMYYVIFTTYHEMYVHAIQL